MNRDRRLNIDWCLKIRPKGRKAWRIGLTVDSIGRPECTYLFRIAFWLEPFISLRLHKFLRSDDDRNLHDHPWWFITFPFRTYYEYLPAPEGGTKVQEVKGWRFHYRPAEYRHAVIMPPSGKPFWTFVLTGVRFREWGFWVQKTFVQWQKYFNTYGQAPCSDPKGDRDAN